MGLDEPNMVLLRQIGLACTQQIPFDPGVEKPIEVLLARAGGNDKACAQAFRNLREALSHYATCA